jgi:hypothetical protein
VCVRMCVCVSGCVYVRQGVCACVRAYVSLWMLCIRCWYNQSMACVGVNRFVGASVRVNVCILFVS